VWNPGNISSDTLDIKEAANYYRKAVFYPNSNDRATKAVALYRAALMNAKLGNLDIAKKAYAEVINSYPESPYSNLARTKLLDPANTEELAITPEMIAQQKAAQQPATATEEPAATEMEGMLPQAVSDSLDIQLPADESDQPIIIDTTQTMLPDSNE
jgi:tetratricopeptide (TPR) repeat protein